MTAVLVKSAFQSTFPDSGDTTKYGPTAHNAARLFSAGTIGDVCVRDTGSASGASWRDPGLVDIRVYGAALDGVTNDAAAWTAALAVVASAGGGIFCPAGTSLVSSTLTISASNVRITGVGAASILKASAASFNVFTLGAVSGVTIRDLQIQGAATTNGTTQFGIYSLAGTVPTDCRIDNVLFSGPDASTGLNNGVKFDTSADRNHVTGCTFQRLIGTIAGTGYGVILGEADDCVITRNRFLGAAGQGRHAVYLSTGSSYNLVAHNLVSNFNEDGITLSTTAANPTSTYNQILSNTILGGGSAALDSGGISVYGDITHTAIRGNVVSGYNGYGIVISDAAQGGLTKSSVVSDNQVNECQLGGILVMGGKFTAIRGNYVWNNSQASAGSYNGIDIRSNSSGGAQVADGTSVIGNVSFGAQQRNALNINSSAPAPTTTVILGNHFGAGLVGTLQLNSVACISWGNAIGTLSATYAATNVSVDRTYDADTVLVAELADIVGTLIADLRAQGLVL